MGRCLPLILILTLLLTGIGLGAARGTVLRGERIVLCTGHGVVITHRPASDGGGTSAHFCPDMALSLLAGIATDAVLPRPGGRITLMRGVPQRSLAARVRARGPPVAVG